MRKIDEMHKSSGVYSKEKQKERFKIRHSAKDVVYNVKSFIERNVDEISPSLENCINNKSDTIISNIFQGIVKSKINQSFSKEEEKKQMRPGAVKRTIW
jgi:myosin heavy subunit